MTAAASLGLTDDFASPPADERAWRAWAENQIATLQQALQTAQAQLSAAQHTSLPPTQPGGGTCTPAAEVAAQLLAQHPQPVVLVSAAGQVQCANAAATALAARVGDELTCPNTPVMEVAQAVLRTNTPRQQHLQLAGQPYHLEGKVISDGVAALYFTALRPAEHPGSAPLAPQPDFYETILQQLPVEVAVFDAGHRYRFVNANGILDADTRIWVIGHDDFAYCTHFQRPRELAVQRRACFEQAVQTRAAVAWEEVQETDAGPQHMRRHFLPVFASDGSLRMMVGMGVDITERRQVEKQLAEQRAFYEFVLDQLPCDVGVFDDKFRYLFVNASGIKDPEVRRWIIGKDNFTYFSHRNLPEAMAQERHAQLEQVVRERRLVTYEETFLRPDGDRHQYRCLQPVFHPDGSLHMILGYGLDVTERVATERALRHAKLAAESAVRARELFLANMSHEIRTPMNAILGMGQLLAKTELTPLQSSYQQAITTSADNLLVIINDILDLSKLEAGKMVLEQVGFSPAQLLAQVEQTLHYKAAEKGLCLSTQAGPGLPAVLLGDPYRITQVLLNLAGNAIKFTEKGRVVISCQVVEAGAPAGTADVLFRVTDTGVGIEPEFLAHIFQEFSQEDASVTRKFGGTGLGLPICRNLVKLMGGDVQLESEKHQGTVTQFTLRLPIGTEQDLLPQVVLTEDSPLRQHLRHKHVLLVEDNRFNRQIAKTFLQQAQVQVTEAEHGEQAVALAREQAFDLILMDIQMPVLDGYGATAALRQQLQLTTPIVALTANAIKGEREKCLAGGMNAYLAKPFQEAELLKVVSEWVVPQSRATATAPASASSLLPAATPPPALYQTDELLKVGQGDQSFVNFMLETFVESSEELLQELAQALQEGNIGRLKTVAHTLKPGLAHLRVQHLLPAVTELDQWPGEFQPEAVGALVATITQQLREVISQMQAALEAAPVSAAK
ncbi:signal transduction histidine kinase/DNA-binding NarL/FixJ family response regulator [Hymenobacter luteus]|uniref:Sensory/regulatory protein RpfC n=2 Tax=Hymenobacter TaxID=89966 RepID=A0A7W9WAN7_9BACT|nr:MULTISPECIES: ATP-binding protein [Hymenobacter]MBB4599557.1 signal transduction histidine kinase/DNA-binding NarL/FixJ family response regulator [Hymenobacter latericoloratus]MBB6058133.1 signal transduction histidine kinase/DNA-binding NarL/FixJ family response regulator [Hymenobacter luteus]